MSVGTWSGKMDTMVRWVWWAGWSPEQFEDWLEEQAARGWHLIKADRLLLRCHFRRGEPRKVRYCVDYPAEVSSDYYTLYHDAGWELVASSAGWYIWRTEYDGERRPQLFNDIQPLIERNNRLMLVCSLGLLSQVTTFLGPARDWFLSTATGRMALIPYTAVLLVLAAALGAIARQTSALRQRRS